MSIFGYPPDGVSFTLSAGEGVTITFSDNTYTVSATGSNADASYITYNDETGTFPNSSRLAAGNNVTFDNTGGVFTINAAATGGGAPTTLSYVTTNSEAALSGERVLTEAYGVSITDNTTTVDVGLSPTFLAIPFFTIGNHAGLTGERSLVVLDGLASSDLGSGSTLSISASPLQQPEYITVSSSSNLPNERVLTAGTGIEIDDAGAGSTITVSNTSSAFNTIQVSGQSDVVADALADTLTFVAGSNVTITTSGDSITIAATDTTNPDQNLFETISVAGQSDIVADSTTDTLTFAPGDGVEITTNASTDTLTITNTASSFNQIVVFGQSDIVASQILNSFEVAEGTGITLTTSGSTLTIENSSPNVVQNVFTTFAVSGQNDVVADSSTDTLTLVAGEGVDITTDDTTDSITLSNSSSGFNQILVSGQSDVVASELHNSLEFVAGTNITLTTSGTSVTINATGGGDAPADAEYLVLSANGTLTDERVLTPGTGLTLVDGGAGNSATLSNTASSFGKIVVVGESDIDAHYLQDQFALEAGSNVTLTVTGSTINIASVGASGGGGGAPTDAQYVVLATNGTLSDERVLAVGSGLDLSDGGAGNNVTLTNSASSFGRIKVTGQNDVVSYLLQDQFGLVEGSNVTITTSGSDITIASTDTGDINQNAYSFIAPTGFPTLSAGSPTSILAVNGSGGVTVGTNNGALTISGSGLQPLDSDLTALAGLSGTGLVSRTGAATYVERTITAGNGISIVDGDGVSGNPTITSTASGFNTIQISGQGDVVADATNDTLTLVAGSNVTLTTSGDSITIAATDTTNPDQNLFETISVAGQSDVVADSTTDTLTLVNGTGVDITTNPSTDSITFSNTASSFGTVVVDGSPINSTLLQGQFGLTAGSNVTLTPSGTSIEIAATDTGEANQNAFSNIATTGWPTASADSTTDTLVIEGSGGIYIGIDSSTDTVTISGTGLQPLDGALTGLSGYNSNGLVVQTSQNNFTGRSIASGTGVSVSNGDGVSGNPTISNSASGFQQFLVSGQGTIQATELHNSMEFIAGSNVILTTSGTSMTLSVPGASGQQNQNAFNTLSVAGQNDIVADSPTDTLTAAAGTGISLTTNDTTDTLTLSNTASSFGTVVIDNTTDIDSYSLQGSFGLNAGSNITLTPSATGVTIASSGGGETNQNAYSQIDVPGWPSLTSSDPTDAFTVSGVDGIAVGTVPGTNTLIISATGIADEVDMFRSVMDSAGCVLNTTTFAPASGFVSLQEDNAFSFDGTVLTFQASGTYLVTYGIAMASAVTVQAYLEEDTGGGYTYVAATDSVDNSSNAAGVGNTLIKEFAAGDKLRLMATASDSAIIQPDNAHFSAVRFTGGAVGPQGPAGTGGGSFLTAENISETLESLPTSGNWDKPVYIHYGDWTSTGAITITVPVIKIYINGNFTVDHTITATASSAVNNGGKARSSAMTGAGVAGGGYGGGGLIARAQTGGGGGGGSGGAGGAGQGDSNTTTNQGGAGGYAVPLLLLEPGGGGAGGTAYTAGTAAGAGGAGGACVYLEVSGNVDINETVSLDGQAGTAGGAADFQGGGGGGAGGRWICICGGTWDLAASKEISLDGKNGGAGTGATWAGGGGGGGGGGYSYNRAGGVLTINGTISVSAGTVGSGGQNGTNGSAGISVTFSEANVYSLF